MLSADDVTLFSGFTVLTSVILSLTNCQAQLTFSCNVFCPARSCDLSKKVVIRIKTQSEAFGI